MKAAPPGSVVTALFRRARVGLPLAGVGLTAGFGLWPALHGAVHFAAASGSTLSITQTWTRTLPDAGSPVALSSPNVAMLPGGPAVVVGDRAGEVYAINLASGNNVAGWPYNTGAPVDSTPSVVSLSGNGLDTVFVGSGNAASPTVGGYHAITPQGTAAWYVRENNPSTDPFTHSGVQASMAVGSLQGGGTDVVAPSLGQEEYAMNAANGSILGGFPWFQADSSFSTPAIADLYGNGQNDIIEGNDSSAGFAYGTSYANGGHLRVLSPSGNAGSSNPAGGLICQFNTNQTAQSSPAVGEFLANGTEVGIVFGTGTTFPGASDTNTVIALSANCDFDWSRTLDGATASSPALADVLGNGQLQVVQGTNNNFLSGSIWVLNGTNGQTLWHASTTAAVVGSPVTADLTGSGYQDVLVPTIDGLDIFDGRTGAFVALLGQNEGFQNSPLITDDPNGTIGITTAGYLLNTGTITHYEVTGSKGSLVNEKGAWPMFHHDPQLTGNAGVPPPILQVPCSAPKSDNGYVMAASDGGIFTFGSMPFCGSTGAIELEQPIVGMARTPNGGGYWTVARDGGVFSFGNATFYGSEGGASLSAPIVGMAATPDGKGYWLVASDGGVFGFGDAHYDGSMGGQPLSAPIVGIAATPSGNGYWLVAADGGVFGFGSARFAGSMGGKPLDAPIVGIASDPANATGYWLVASDGGIFNFGGAPYEGSLGGTRLHAPIVGVEPTSNGAGYRFVGADGGIFSFGNAHYYGSEGGQPLNRPIVAVAGF